MMRLTDKPKRAVAYYRHSAEDKQENSVEIQRDHVAAFAKAHDVEIIAECIDDGLTGTNAKRAGFQELLNQWVNNPTAQFEYVFVLDVSRFGRFKNPDEAGMYVFQCSANNRQVIYSRRGFPAKGQELMYHVMEAVERVSATAYISDLSDKVWHGQVKITEQGFSAGGSAPYGLKRILLNEDKSYRQDLKLGEQKYIANQRVTLAPGDTKEQKVVRLIFELYVLGGYVASEIACMLETRKITSPSGKKKWSSSTVLGILRNRKYAGAAVYNKTSQKVYEEHGKVNAPTEWVVKDDAFKGIVSIEIFDKAQAILALRRSCPASAKVTVEPQRLEQAVQNSPVFIRDWLRKRLGNVIVVRQKQQGTAFLWVKRPSTTKKGWEYQLISENDILHMYEKQGLSLIDQFLVNT